MKKIKVIRLASDVLLGTSLEPCKCLTEGGALTGVPYTLDFYDEMFFVINFIGKTKEQKYSQLIPFARVDTIIFTESK